MKALAVAGPSDAGKTTLVERLTERLAERGSVGTVKHLDCEPDLDTEGTDTARHRAAGAATTIGVGPAGWFASGEGGSLEAALDRLAPDHDYALVEGYGASDLPTVALGDRAVEGTVIHSAPSAAAVDVEAVLRAVEDLEPFETLSSLVARAKRADGEERAGAIATFTGRVRRRDGPGDPPTEYLEFERYDGVASSRMEAIRDDLRARDGVQEALLHHRTGVVEAGEDVVFVVVLAGHRAAAFRAVEDGVDRLTAEVPLFESEVTVEGAFWRHQHEPRPDDGGE